MKALEMLESMKSQKLDKFYSGECYHKHPFPEAVRAMQTFCDTELDTLPKDSKPLGALRQALKVAEDRCNQALEVGDCIMEMHPMWYGQINGALSAALAEWYTQEAHKLQEFHKG